MTFKVKSVLTGACSLLAFNAAVNGQAHHKKPNVVVFVADDAGMDFGCYGNPNIHTPNIDRLAANGVRFEKAFVTSPQSSPSRTSMMTGSFAHTIGTEDLHDPLNATTNMLPHYFNEAGYSTAVMLKTHWGPNGDKQFGTHIKGGYKPNQGPLSNELYDNYRNFIDGNKNKPFFLWVGFIDPHRPYNRENCPQVNSPDAIDVPPYLVDDLQTRRDMADYYDEISRMDSDIGCMIAELEKRKMADNTIFVFLSDNGMPFPRCKGTLYDAGIQTPLVFSWAGRIRPGNHSNGLVTTADLAPTLLELAGIEGADDFYGESFSPLLSDTSKRGRDYIFAERNWHDTDEYIRCVRSEDLKLIYNAYYELPHGTPIDLSTSPSWYSLAEARRNGTLTPVQSLLFAAPRPMVEIYDLKNDPYETENVADRPEYLSEGKKLARELNKWRNETNDVPWWKKRRADQNDRITGFPLFETRPGLYVE